MMDISYSLRMSCRQGFHLCFAHFSVFRLQLKQQVVTILKLQQQIRINRYMQTEGCIYILYQMLLLSHVTQFQAFDFSCGLVSNCVQDSAHLIYIALFLANVFCFPSSGIIYNSHLYVPEMWENCLRLNTSQRVWDVLHKASQKIALLVSF